MSVLKELDSKLGQATHQHFPEEQADRIV